MPSKQTERVGVYECSRSRYVTPEKLLGAASPSHGGAEKLLHFDRHSCRFL